MYVLTQHSYTMEPAANLALNTSFSYLLWHSFLYFFQIVEQCCANYHIYHLFCSSWKKKKRSQQWKLLICSQISQVYALQVILDQIPSPICITTVLIDRTMENGHSLGKLKLSQNALTNRTEGTAASISRLMCAREVKIRTSDHGTLDSFFFFHCSET